MRAVQTQNLSELPRQVTPEQHLQNLVGKIALLRLELLSLTSEIERAAAEVLIQQRMPEPEYLPELRTLKQIGQEFFRDAYPKAAAQQRHAYEFCRQHGLLAGQEGQKRSSLLIDRKAVLRLMAGGNLKGETS